MTSWSLLACAGPAAAAGALSLPPVPPPVAAAPRSMAISPVATTPAELCLQNGRAATAEGRTEEALAWFDRALLHDPRLGIAHLCRAFCLLALERENEAAGALLAALDANPRDPAPRLELARLHARGGDHALAMQVIGPALQAAPHIAARVRDDAAFRGLRDHPTWLAMTGAL